VPVIAVPFALRRAAASAVEATNGPAVQSLTRAPPSPPLDFLILKNRKPIHRQIIKFSETETRISID